MENDPQRSNNNIEPITQPKMYQQPKKSKLSIIITIILSIALLCALGFIFWQNFLATNNKTSQSDTNPSSSNNIVAINTHPVTAMIIDKILAKYNLVTSSNQIKQPTDVYIEQSNLGPVWKIDNTNRYVNYTDQNASSLTISIFSSTQTEWTTVYNEMAGFVQSTFEANNLAKTSDDIYSGNDIICSTDSQSDNISSLLSVACGQESKYNINLPEYVVTKPFFDAIEGKISGSSDGIKIPVNNMIVKDGKNGHMNTYLPIANAAALFYKAPNGQWTYFKSTQDVIDCGDYNTASLKSAFAYEFCYDNSNNRELTVLQYYSL